MVMTATFIYKITPRAAWDAAVAQGTFTGAPVDLADGFIHFSAADQVAETAAKHFRNQTDLVLVAIDAGALGAALKWEPSRGGALFPHLYAPLDVTHARMVFDLPLDADGVPVAPGDLSDLERSAKREGSDPTC
jgi:uncharacterized protein (DUF952 family)